MTGVDIVEISDFRANIEKGGATFLEKCFFPEESDNASVQSLAGIFAAKEAVMKALSLRAGKWKEIIIKHEADGRPYVEFVSLSVRPISCDVSISHTESSAVAQFVALLP